MGPRNIRDERSIKMIIKVHQPCCFKAAFALENERPRLREKGEKWGDIK